MYIYVQSSWKNPEYLGNSLALVYFCYRIQQGPLLVNMRNTLNICIGFESRNGSDHDKVGANILNNWVNCPKVAVKWQSLPYQYRKSPNLQDNHCVIAHLIQEN